MRARKTTARSVKTQPAQTLVPYLGLINPGTVLLRDGTLVASYDFDGLDQEGGSAALRNNIAGGLDSAVRSFGSDMALWWTVMRTRNTEYPGRGSAENGVAGYIYDILREGMTDGTQYNNRHTLSLAYNPERSSLRLFEKTSANMAAGHGAMNSFLMAAKDVLLHRSAWAYRRNELLHTCAKFERILTEFSGAAPGMNLSRLKLHDLYGFLHAVANPPNRGQPVRLPRHAVMDGQLVDSMITMGERVSLFEHPTGNRYVAVFSIKDWPDGTAPGLLDRLLSVDGELTISHMYRFIDHDEASKYVRETRDHLLATQKTLWDLASEVIFKVEASVNQGKQALAEEAEYALGLITGEGLQFGWHNMTVQCIGRNEREALEIAERAASIVNNSGFQTLPEHANHQSAYAGSLPGNLTIQPRQHFVPTPALSDIAPLYTLHQGHLSNPHLSNQLGRDVPSLMGVRTRYGTPYWFDFFQGDLGHFFLIGKTRSGKSVFVNTCLSQWYRLGHRVIVFDKDRSCRIATLAHGGHWIDITDAESGFRINPVSLIGDPRKRSWLIGWVCDLLEINGYSPSAEDRNDLAQVIDELATTNPEHWRLRSLAAMCNKGLQTQLMPWCEGGEFGHLFDNDEDHFDVGMWTTFELHDLFLRYGRAVAPFLAYAFLRIDDVLGDVPTVIYLEEAWLPLQNPMFARFVDNWLRTMAKRLAVLGMATQSLDEIRRSDIVSSIIDSVPTKIFLPLPEAATHAETYIDIFGLAPHQVQEIASARQKREYLLCTEAVSRWLVVDIPKECLAFVRSDAVARNAFDRHFESRHEHDDWLQSYHRELMRST